MLAMSSTSSVPPRAARLPRLVLRPNRPPEPAARPRVPRILFINQYYWPDHASTAQHLTDLAEALAVQGFECHVLCGRGKYKPKPGGDPPPPAWEVRHGVTIHRVWASSLGRRSVVARMTDYLSYYAGAALKTLALPRFDAVVTLTTPPLIGLVGSVAKKIKGSKHIIWSMDLHPDASIALKAPKPPGRLFRVFQWLSDGVVRSADRVVALGPYMAERLRSKGTKPGRIVEIPVWNRRDEIQPLPRAGHPLRAELGLADKVVAMYSGNLGLAHTFDEFLEAARRLRHRSDLAFLFVGGGPRLKEVIAAKEADQLENLLILDYFPREQLRFSLSVADLHLISMRAAMTGIVVPGKLYGIMASGRPALFVGPRACESARTILEADCGAVVAEGDVDHLVRTLELWADHPELREAMGQRGRHYFLEHHEASTCCQMWADLLKAELITTPSRDSVPGVPPAPHLVSRGPGQTTRTRAVSETARFWLSSPNQSVE